MCIWIFELLLGADLPLLVVENLEEILGFQIYLKHLPIGYPPTGPQVRRGLEHIYQYPMYH